MSKREVLLEALGSTPGDLRLTVGGMAETAVFHQLSSAEWSVVDVVYHLGEVEGRYLGRLERVVKEERPYLPFIHPEEKAGMNKKLEDLMQEFRDRRQQTMAFLQALKPGQWQRKGIHETWGEVSLRYLVQQLVEHDIEHLNQIVEIQRRARSEERKIVNRQS